MLRHVRIAETGVPIHLDVVARKHGKEEVQLASTSTSQSGDAEILLAFVVDAETVNLEYRIMKPAGVELTLAEVRIGPEKSSQRSK